MSKIKISEVTRTILSVLDNLSDDIVEVYTPLLAHIIEANHDLSDFIYDTDDDERKTIIEAMEEIKQNYSDDFTLEFDGNEYRIISEEAIWGIYKEEIQTIVQDCYDLKLDDLPDFLSWSIDWEKTAENCYTDGYGRTFSTYDGSEIETRSHYIFRLG